MRYVAFLRGINVGGNANVPMAELKVVFESLGFTEVKTLLNSGNVIFNSSIGKELGEKIEESLKKEYGWRIPVILRTLDEINQLIKVNPFKGVKVTAETRFYVTFFAKPQTKKIGEVVMAQDIQIKRVSKNEICCTIEVSPQKNTSDLMKTLEKIFSKEITTRNWNTLVKISNF